MEVIQIPSKNIFSIDNQKVVDNQIDKIEVHAKNGVLEITKKVVFNEDIVSDESFEDENHDEVGAGYVRSNTDFTLRDFECAYVSLQGTYKKYKVKIPISGRGNYYIREIIDDVNNSGNANINYSLVGKKDTGTVLGNIILAIRTNTATSVACTIASVRSVTLDKPTIFKTEENIQLFYNENLRNIIEGLDDPFYAAKTSIDDLTNVKNIKAKLNSDENCYELEFQILTDLARIATRGQVQNPTAYNIITDTNIPARLIGSQENYIATRVTLTVNGTVLELNLEDETITIGSGNDIISFSGNELMQTTNTPSLQDTYGKVIEQYKEGKEIATIRCSIDNYYNEKTMYINILSVETIPSGLKFASISTKEKLEVNDRLSLEDGTELIVNSYSNNIYYCAVSPSSALVTLGKTRVSIPQTKRIAIDDAELPMTFHIGDTVIPYVYGANSEDRPMSTYKDGTPKIFEVLSSKVYYDGAVWQELVLVET